MTRKSLYDENVEAASVDALGSAARAAIGSGPTDFGQEPPTVREVKHYCIESGHLVTLRSLAERLDEKGLPSEAQEIMEIVRYAHVMDKV